MDSETACSACGKKDRKTLQTLEIRFEAALSAARKSLPSLIQCQFHDKCSIWYTSICCCLQSRDVAIDTFLLYFFGRGSLKTTRPWRRAILTFFRRQDSSPRSPTLFVLYTASHRLVSDEEATYEKMRVRLIEAPRDGDAHRHLRPAPHPSRSCPILWHSIIAAKVGHLSCACATNTLQYWRRVGSEVSPAWLGGIATKRNHSNPQTRLMTTSRSPTVRAASNTCEPCTSARYALNSARQIERVGKSASLFPPRCDWPSGLNMLT
jgi:hypothetical protein